MKRKQFAPCVTASCDPSLGGSAVHTGPSTCNACAALHLTLTTTTTITTTTTTSGLLRSTDCILQPAAILGVVDHLLDS